MTIAFHFNLHCLSSCALCALIVKGQRTPTDYIPNLPKYPLFVIGTRNKNELLRELKAKQTALSEV